MKVAVLEPFPRICGVTTWTFHVADGFRQLGLECDVVSFTTSGRRRTTRSRKKDGKTIGAGWHWWHEAPDVVRKWSDASATLNDYDLIVLNEPKNGTADRDATKRKTSPEYIEALQGSHTYWTSILHAPQYDQKRAPFLAELFERAGKTFTGTFIEHQPGSYDSGAYVFAPYTRKIQQWPWLPYRQRGRTPDVDRIAQVGIGGRMTPNKGHGTLAYLGDRFPTHWQTRLFGGESGGAGACFSFNLYEALVMHHGWEGVRYGQLTVPPSKINSYGDTIHAWPWWVQKDGHLVQFTGAYEDIIAEWTRCGVAINLTSSDFALGLEYTSLEAMDAGCAIILPAHSLQRTGRDGYDVRVLEKYTKTMSVGKKGMRVDRVDGEALDEIVAAVTDTIAKVESGGHDPAVNRAALTQNHDPRHVAGQIITMVTT